MLVPQTLKSWRWEFATVTSTILLGCNLVVRCSRNRTQGQNIAMEVAIWDLIEINPAPLALA